MARISKSMIWLVMLLASLKQSYSADYCKHDLCGAGKAHIGCNNDGKLSPQCPKGAKVVKMTDQLKQIILDTHNKYRSELATGAVDWLPQAASMPSLTWDNELAKTAQMNANRCVRGHDACHNTEKYKNSGQNLNFFATTEDKIDVEGQVPNLITSWWDERHDVDENMVNTMYDPGKSIMVFHFAVMGSDKVNKVGCAITQWKPEKGWNQIYLVCNYSFNDFIGIPIYVAGEPCSQCTKGCNPKFEGLCAEDEPVTVPVDYAI